jgi:hypothetical protein
MEHPDKNKKKGTAEKNAALDNLNYPASDDIYNQLEKESEIDPENISKKKDVVKIDTDSKWNEMSFENDETGSDLDVPGSELDDEQESIGSEDEENNSYSIGGENHANLEENKEGA